MSSASLQIDGVQITSSAEFLRFLDLVDNDEEAVTTRGHEAQKLIKRQGTTKITDPPRMFALIIGINKYVNEDLLDLRGAVSDARAIQSYLKDNLSLDGSHIRMLLDEDATRKGIIDALIALRDNDNIQHGEAILIYYAGHGQEVPAPDGWATLTEGKEHLIQSIVPQDFDEDKGIHVIPDRTFGWLIEDIMEKRGDNITVILDCCHSGSGTRNDDRNRMARTALLEDYYLPPNLDKDIKYLSKNQTNRSNSSSNGFSTSGLSSHVLLAACSAKELARESHGRGQFTRSLENALKTVSPDQITYIQLLDRLQDISEQNPQLEGDHKDRIVFNSKAAVRVRDSFKISLDESGNYILQAGTADGVCLGAEFTVYADHGGLLKEPSLGVMVPDTIRPFETVMRPLSEPGPSFDKAALAVQTRAGDQEELKVYIPLEAPLIPVFKATLMQMKTSGDDRHRIALVDDRSVAHLAVERDNDKIAFIILDERVTAHGLTKCPYTADAVAEQLIPVLQGAAHYHYHLNRSYLNSEKIGIEVEFFKLEFSGQLDESTSRLLRRPYGDNMLKDGIITIPIRDGVNELFGIRITNKSKKDLYPNIFYFDNSELSVTQYFSSGGPGQFKVDSPLPKDGGMLNLGFGIGSTRSYEYFIPDGQDVDVGFLKCFFSTSPVDLSRIAQIAAFNTAARITKPHKMVSGAWGSILIPVVQKRVK
ncbi:hypothetical protein GALMADRAFT_147105 [Galerina marginata CBS 339.88]|uniref:Peptidase C14 caspase domain-containing protein n=1 Tax=Galerina marginata (strain CBS 339.88) TaxID=685588 RepID=A0A067SIN2_GALM3|nr:hypothetical protein GALMADRAFT_147105 [Galerina marginata CBS 339.88]